MRLVELAHTKIQEILRSGDYCIDATAGNGNDTLFLARQVEPDGKVLAVDIQECALRKTEHKLEHHGFSNLLQTIHGSHAEMKKHLREVEAGSVTAAMFNLGYLPGGDHGIATTAETTSQAISEIYQKIRVGGIISVLCYRGHEGGTEEAMEVFKLCEIKKWKFETLEGNQNPSSPILILIERI